MQRPTEYIDDKYSHNEKTLGKSHNQLHIVVLQMIQNRDTSGLIKLIKKNRLENPDELRQCIRTCITKALLDLSREYKNISDCILNYDSVTLQPLSFAILNASTKLYDLLKGFIPDTWYHRKSWYGFHPLSLALNIKNLDFLIYFLANHPFEMLQPAALEACILACLKETDHYTNTKAIQLVLNRFPFIIQRFIDEPVILLSIPSTPPPIEFYPFAKQPMKAKRNYNASQKMKLVLNMQEAFYLFIKSNKLVPNNDFIKLNAETNEETLIPNLDFIQALKKTKEELSAVILRMLYTRDEQGLKNLYEFYIKIDKKNEPESYSLQIKELRVEILRLMDAGDEQQLKNLFEFCIKINNKEALSSSILIIFNTSHQNRDGLITLYDLSCKYSLGLHNLCDKKIWNGFNKLSLLLMTIHPNFIEYFLLNHPFKNMSKNEIRGYMHNCLNKYSYDTSQENVILMNKLLQLILIRFPFAGPVFMEEPFASFKTQEAQKNKNFAISMHNAFHFFKNYSHRDSFIHIFDLLMQHHEKNEKAQSPWAIR